MSEGWPSLHHWTKHYILIVLSFFCLSVTCLSKFDRGKHTSGDSFSIRKKLTESRILPTFRESFHTRNACASPTEHWLPLRRKPRKHKAPLVPPESERRGVGGGYTIQRDQQGRWMSQGGCRFWHPSFLLKHERIQHDLVPFYLFRLTTFILSRSYPTPSSHPC